MVPEQMREKILVAIDALVAEGGEITYEAVREQVGGGSYGPIGEVIRAWRRERSQRPVQPAVTLPAALETRLMDVGLALWGQAQAEAEQRLRVAVQALAQEREVFESERDDLVQMADRLTYALQQKDDVLQHLTEERRHDATTIGELRTRLQHLKGCEQELTACRERCTELQRELTVRLAQEELLRELENRASPRP